MNLVVFIYLFTLNSLARGGWMELTGVIENSHFFLLSHTVYIRAALHTAGCLLVQAASALHGR